MLLRHFPPYQIKPLAIISLLCALVLSPKHQLLAQNKLPQIKEKIAKAKTDSLRAEAYIDLAYEYFYYSLDSLDQVIEAAYQAEKIAKKSKVINTLITAYNVKSRAYSEKGEYKNSEIEIKKGIAIAHKNGLIKKRYQMEDNLAHTLFDQGKKDEALALKIKALKAFKKMGDTVSSAITEWGLGVLYLELNQFEKAKTRFFKSIEMNPNARSNIESYGNLGIIYEKQNKLDSALIFLERAAKAGEEYPSFVLQNQVNIAEVYHKKGDIQKALTMLLAIKEEYKENSEERDYQYYNLIIAEYYTELNNWQRAEEFLTSIDTNIILNKNKFKKSYGQSGHIIYSKKGNYKEALHYFTLYRDAVDSMENAKRDSSFKFIESKFELGQKEIKINKQKLKIRNFSLGLGGALALLTVGSILFFGYRRKTSLEQKLTKEKTEKQLIEIENLKKEVKIISMQSMIEGQEEERKRIARDLHDNIGTLMTSIKIKVLAIQREVQNLEKMNIATELDSMIDSASQQVRRISYSMTPVALDISGLAHAIKDLGQQLIDNDIELHANLRPLEEIKNKKLTINIYRILQELVQNIIKHSQATEVNIDISEEENNLIMRIRDNGIGMSEETWETTKSIGVNNIKSRVNYLNGTIKFVTDIGTHFKITVPLVQEE